MARYGFRLFAVELRPDNTRTGLPLRPATPSDSDNLSKLVDALKPHAGETIALIRATSADSGGGETEDLVAGDEVKGSTVRVLTAEQEGGQGRFLFYWGSISNGLAVDPLGVVDDTPLEGKSVMHHYRASLVGLSGATVGILAVEVNGNTCPERAFRRGIRKVTDTKWSLFMRTRVTGNAEWTSLINNGLAKEARFFDYGFSADGAPKPVEMSVPLAADPVTQDAIKERVRGWFKDKRGLKKTAAEEKDVAIAEIVKTAVGKEVNDLSFDDYAVEFQFGDIKRRLRATSTFNNFTYETGDNRPSDAVFYEQTLDASTALIEAVQQSAVKK